MVDRYVERANRLAPVRVRVVPGSGRSDLSRRSHEETESLRRVATGSTSVLLTPRGDLWSSEELAEFLRRQLVGSSRPTVFAVGSDVGFVPEDEAWADYRLSLSRMTLTHEISRVVLAEQTYRALTIIRNMKYHK